MKKIRFLNIIMALTLILGLSACTTASKNTSYTYKNPSQINDPLEPVNRAVFGLNNAIDVFLIEPISKVYLVVVPEPVRDSVQNFMRNLRTPVYVANNLLQGDLGDAGVGTARFVINTTVGVGGLFDVAANHQGLMFEQEDFGQTLAVWGLGDGFYIVLPVLGPSSLRDTAGLFTDAYVDPVRLAAYSDHNTEWVYYARGALEGIDKRSRMIDTVADLRRNSLDYYAAVRSIYAQKRFDLIHENNGADYAYPDYDDNF